MPERLFCAEFRVSLELRSYSKTREFLLAAGLLYPFDEKPKRVSTLCDRLMSLLVSGMSIGNLPNDTPIELHKFEFAAKGASAPIALKREVLEERMKVVLSSSSQESPGQGSSLTAWRVGGRNPRCVLVSDWLHKFRGRRQPFVFEVITKSAPVPHCGG